MPVIPVMPLMPVISTKSLMSVMSVISITTFLYSDFNRLQQYLRISVCTVCKVQYISIYNLHTVGVEYCLLL